MARVVNCGVSDYFVSLDRALHILNVIQQHFGTKRSSFAKVFGPPSHKT